MPLARAKPRASTTSAAVEQRAISAGRRSMSPFQTERALSYSASVGAITCPLNDSRNLASSPGSSSDMRGFLSSALNRSYNYDPASDQQSLYGMPSGRVNDS